MKRTLTLWAIAGGCLGLALLSTSWKTPSSSVPMPHQRVHTQYIEGLEALKRHALELHRRVRALEAEPGQAAPPEALEQARAAFLKCRDAFKEIEYMLAYLDPSFTTNYVNGAPLPTLEEHVPEIRVLEPEGLQIIEEKLFAEEVAAEWASLQELTRRLTVTLGQILPRQKAVFIADRQVFEAIRLELVRVFSQGITGFDSPVLVRSLEESQTALRSAFEALAYYYPALGKRDRALAERLETTASEALAYLEAHPDFDTFDRLHFLRTYIDPLFEDVLQAQQALYIETIYEVSSRKQSVNHLATSLFAEDFLNPYYYLKGSAKSFQKPEVVALGQKLFYDPLLSHNNQRSCASCHRPTQAFTDGMPTSLAFDFEGTLERNAPTLINSLYSESYFHDLREDVLAEQIEHVIASELEFHTSYSEIVDKIAQSTEYRALFAEAFPVPEGRDPVNPSALSKAIAAYVAQLRGFDSPFDRYARGETEALSASAKRGFNLFMGKGACATCHFPPTFHGLVPPLYQESESEVLGTPATADTLHPTLDDDLGRAAGKYAERSEIYLHSFKTPTVRNAALTAPYMHNGVYSTLEEVIRFYNVGGGLGMGLEVPNQTLPGDSLHLSHREQQDLIAFMEALTDTSGLPGPPTSLPAFEDEQHRQWNERLIGGKY